MEINDLLRMQIKSVFAISDKRLSPDEIRERAGIPLEKWNNLNNRGRTAVAKGLGFVSLSEAIEIVQRPTYFKQVLKSDTSIIEALDSKHDYDCVVRELIREMVNFKLTLSEAEKNPILRDLYKEYKRVETKFNADSWQAQTDDRLPVLVEQERKTSFQTTPWPERRRNILRALYWRWPQGQSQYVDDINGLLKSISSSQTTYDDIIYVPRSCFNGLPSLETPLE